MNRSLVIRIMLGVLACSPAVCQSKVVQVDIQVVQPMHFGGLLVSPFGGSVTLTEDGALVPDGGGIVPTSQSPCAEARIRLIGPAGVGFSIKVDPSTPVLSGASGAVVRLAEFKSSLSAWRGTFDGTGQAEVKLGGRLDVPAGTAPGLYRAAQVNLQLAVPGQSTVTMPFLISAVLRAPLLLNATADLDFGSIIPGSQAGLFQVFPAGGYQSVQASGPMHFKGRPEPATFQLQGPVGTSFSIQLPQNILLIGPGQPLQVLGFTCSTPQNGVLPAGGLTFGVGAGLMVSPQQVSGIYRGTFTVTVNYQ
jgi:hypothetical protein